MLVIKYSLQFPLLLICICSFILTSSKGSIIFSTFSKNYLLVSCISDFSFYVLPLRFFFFFCKLCLLSPQCPPQNCQYLNGYVYFDSQKYFKQLFSSFLFSFLSFFLNLFGVYVCVLLVPLHICSFCQAILSSTMWVPETHSDLQVWLSVPLSIEASNQPPPF